MVQWRWYLEIAGPLIGERAKSKAFRAGVTKAPPRPECVTQCRALCPPFARNAAASNGTAIGDRDLGNIEGRREHPPRMPRLVALNEGNAEVEVYTLRVRTSVLDMINRKPARREQLGS